MLDEQPVCTQDQRDSLFIRQDSFVSPCINLVMGGETFFLGHKTNLPTVHYGLLPTQELMDMWETDSCGFY
jgi:hypothetical protein